MVRLIAYLLDVIAAVVLVRLVGRVLNRLFGVPKDYFWSSQSAAPRSGPSQPLQGVTARDPVCGMFVSTELSHRLTRGRDILHFCSRECLERYEKSAPNS